MFLFVVLFAGVFWFECCFAVFCVVCLFFILSRFFFCYCICLLLRPFGLNFSRLALIFLLLFVVLFCVVCSFCLFNLAILCVSCWWMWLLIISLCCVFVRVDVLRSVFLNSISLFAGLLFFCCCAFSLTVGRLSLFAFYSVFWLIWCL